MARLISWQTQWAKMTSADFMNIQRKLSELSGVAIDETVEAAQEQQMANQANIANMTYEEAREQFLAEFSNQTTDRLILDLIGYTMLNMADSQELDGKRETNPEKLENNIRVIDPRWQQAWQNNTNLDQQAPNDLLDLFPEFVPHFVSVFRLHLADFPRAVLRGEKIIFRKISEIFLYVAGNFCFSHQLCDCVLPFHPV